MDEVTRAIYHKDIQELTRLLDPGAHANGALGPLETADKDLGQNLLIAVEIGWTEGVKFLLDFGAGINTQNEDGQTPLMIAAASGATEIVHMLIQRGADTAQLDRYENNALAHAYFGFFGPVVTILRDEGLSIPTGSDLQITELHLSAVEGDAAECDRLMREGADPNSACSSGIRPLHCAAHVGSVPAMKTLLAAGADINRRGDAFDDEDTKLPLLGETALEHAILGNQVEAVRFLLDAGADVSGRSYDGTPQGCSLLARAAREGSWKKDARILRLLLERGVREDLRGALGQAACWAGEDAVRLLQEYGAGTNRDDLLFAMKRATDENGFRVLPILYEAGLRLDPPLTAFEVFEYLDTTAGEMALVARGVMRDAGISVDE